MKSSDIRLSVIKKGLKLSLAGWNSSAEEHGNNPYEKLKELYKTMTVQEYIFLAFVGTHTQLQLLKDIQEYEDMIYDGYAPDTLNLVKCRALSEVREWREGVYYDDSDIPRLIKLTIDESRFYRRDLRVRFWDFDTKKRASEFQNELSEELFTQWREQKRLKPNPHA